MTKHAPESDVPAEDREARYHEAVQENKRVLEEASNALKSITHKLDKAAETIADWGDAPFSDLERKP